MNYSTHFVLLSPPSLARRGFRARGRSTADQSIASQLDAATAPPPRAATTTTTHLSALEIHNFALVDFQRISLEPGFNVITGESGSGKSVLIEALSQLLGAPASDEIVRPPSTSAVVQGSIHIAAQDQAAVQDLLTSLGVSSRSLNRSLSGVETLTIRREILSGTTGTRSKCSLNGVATSLKTLKEVGRALVDVNGQHAALSMKDSTTQLSLLDTIAGLSNAAAALDAAWAALRTSRTALQSLHALANEEDRAQLQDLVDDVIVAAEIDPGEDLKLKRQLRQLDSRRDAAERCQLISVGIGGGGGGMLDALHDIEINLRGVVSLEERLSKSAAAAAAAADTLASSVAANKDEILVENDDDDDDREDAALLLKEAMASLLAARQALDDAQNTIEQYNRRYKFSRAEYSQLSDRLQEVQRLMKQYNANSADELVEKAERAAAALDTFYNMQSRREEMEADLSGREATVSQLAVELSAARREAAGKLKNAVKTALRELAMPDAVFDVALHWNSSSSNGGGGGGGGIKGRKSESGVCIDVAQAAKCGETAGEYRMRGGGLDEVEFLFAAGPEEVLKPLSAVASGGEAARVMLAMKAAPTLLMNPEITPHTTSTTTTSSPSSFFSETTTTTPNSTTTTMSPPKGGGGGGLGLSSPILVLDEIDSGVGSRLGQPIGRMLRRMATGNKASQVLCVSHLPQVAAHADLHICVRKQSVEDGGGRMVSRFEALSSREERMKEVAAMLGLPLPAAEEVLLAAEQS